MRKYLDEWISQRIGANPLTREAIETYQLKKLQETLKWAVNNSPFYKARFEGYEISSLEELERLPFTTPDDVRLQGIDMVCTPQSQIARIVTLDTSGTTGEPKRIYFTAEDQELTSDFFHHGMQLMVNQEDTVMILMPCKRPGSIGDLLKTGLDRIGTKVIPYGLPDRGLQDASEILDLMEEKEVTCTVALATQLAGIAKSAGERKIKLRNVLLSAEYVSKENRETITDVFGCPIFEHFGMTETGLGGAVSCHTLEGYHPREADLYFEIIDPTNGQLQPDGAFGELVFTTLTRKGMPFIRYRTGDISRWLTKPCRCGSVLKRLDRVGDRGMAKGGLNE